MFALALSLSLFHCKNYSHTSTLFIDFYFISPWPTAIVFYVPLFRSRRRWRRDCSNNNDNSNVNYLWRILFVVIASAFFRATVCVFAALDLVYYFYSICGLETALYTSWWRWRRVLERLLNFAIKYYIYNFAIGNLQYFFYCNSVFSSTYLANIINPLFPNSFAFFSS